MTSSYKYLDDATLLDLLKQQKRNLAFLEEQSAQMGPLGVPLSHFNQINDIVKELEVINGELESRNIIQKKISEEKILIARSINEAVLDFILAIQLAERGSKSLMQNDYDKAYKDWEVNRADISTRIQAYFQNAELLSEWERLSEATTHLYILQGTWDEPYRTQVINKFKEYISDQDADWKTLRNYKLKYTSETGFQKYFKAWWAIREHILKLKDNLTQKILGLGN
jgi:hypothetical protein